MKDYSNQIFQYERSLYNIENSKVYNCRFEGEKDGESPLKECRNIIVDKCYFNLRYPFWHNENVKINDCVMDDNCRAALWYCKDIHISNVTSKGIKALRECNNVNINNSSFESEEFGWKCNKVVIKDSSFKGPYFLFNTNNITFINSSLNGKYSFQYNNNVKLDNCNLNTKDAFWHTKNVVVSNSTITGEYIGWYSKNLTFVNCIIKGTQPFCYCKNLTLINCQLIDADFAFENSEVNARLNGRVISIKNPLKGKIYVDSVDEIIIEDYIKKPKGKVIIKNKTTQN